MLPQIDTNDRISASGHDAKGHVAESVPIAALFARWPSGKSLCLTLRSGRFWSPISEELALLNYRNYFGRNHSLPTSVARLQLRQRIGWIDFQVFGIVIGDFFDESVFDKIME